MVGRGGKDVYKRQHDYFIKRVADVTGIYESFVNQPDKYIHFVRLDKFLSAELQQKTASAKRFHNKKYLSRRSPDLPETPHQPTI